MSSVSCMNIWGGSSLQQVRCPVYLNKFLFLSGRMLAFDCSLWLYLNFSYFFIVQTFLCKITDMRYQLDWKNLWPKWKNLWSDHCGYTCREGINHQVLQQICISKRMMMVCRKLFTIKKCIIVHCKIAWAEQRFTNFSFPSRYAWLDATAKSCPPWLHDKDVTLLEYLGNWSQQNVRLRKNNRTTCNYLKK